MPHLPRLVRRVPLIGRLFGSKLRTFRAPAAAVPAGPSLVGHGLLRSFGTGSNRTTALKDVSVSMSRGEVNLLMGPSGSGKSTLLAVLSGLLRPDRGAVTALGRDVWEMSERQMEQFRLKHCSYVFQGYNLFPALTARQQLEMVLRWGEGCNPREARKRADYVLGQVGLSHRATLRPNALSGGEKQRVAIARALVKNPSFVFADEPTAALDWENGQQVMNLLRDVARVQNATVLVVTHDHRLETYADRVLEMADGSLRGAGVTSGTSIDDDTGEMTPLPAGKLRLELREPGLVPVG